ncbi:MAG: dethiobiotin synthase [Tissierellia bacterium]|nr:dethiobiotin synthase [Tissierellia bacterium]
MKKSIFITGTDTDIGKTYIAGELVRLLRKEGRNVSYYKGILSGALKTKDDLLPGDALEVIERAGLEDDPKDLVSYIYEEAISPHLAARGLKEKPDLEKIYDDFANLIQKYEGLVVEGSGGILCPLWLEEEVILLEDLIKKLNLSVLVVASSDLGTINHTILTISYLKDKKIPIKGIIFNHYNENLEIHRDNLESIEGLTGISVIGFAKENGELTLRKGKNWWDILELWK